MEAPPPYRQKKSNTGLIIGLIIGGLVLCCVGPALLIGGLGYFGLKQGVPIVTCAMAIDDLQTAMTQYADANGGKLPAANNWQTAIKPYYQKVVSGKKDQNPFGQMSAEGMWGCSVGDEKTGFAFNSDLAGKKIADIKDTSTVMIFEVPTQAMNQAMPYKEQDISKSPKILNDHRGWFVAPVKGEADLISEKGKRVRINAKAGGSSVNVETSMTSGGN